MSSDLWSFATTFYARPGVEATCLRLQQQGADVCLLLCAVWLHQQNIACTPERVKALHTVANPWQQQVVTPIRQLRQSWREAAAHDGALKALREQVKALELHAERELLKRLEETTTNWPIGRAEGDWLTAIAAQHDHDALETLRVAATHA